MKKPKQPTVLATFRVADNVLTHIADTTYRINGKLTQNSDLQAISTHSINLLTRYLDENYIDHNIVIRLDSTVSTEGCNDVPLNILLLAESESSKGISENIKNELCSVVTKFVEDVLTSRGDIFSISNPDAQNIFTHEKSNFIDDHTSNFINKYKGKSITKPFVCTTLGGKPLEIPVQGTFKSTVVKNTDTKDDKTLFAHADGIKGTDMLIFLKIVGAASNVINHKAKTYIAEQESFLKIAAAAYASDNLLVKVVIYEKNDDKGKARSYIKNISSARVEDFEAFELVEYI